LPTMKMILLQNGYIPALRLHYRKESMENKKSPTTVARIVKYRQNRIKSRRGGGKLAGLTQKQYLESKSKKYICEYNGGNWISETYGDKDNNGSCECPVGKNENSFGLCV